MQALLNWLIEPFSQTFTRNALFEMMLISVLAGVVGTFVVLRGIAFIVDGLSHAILPGVAVAFITGGNIFWGALAAALLVTVLVSLTGRNSQVGEDSATGIFFTGAFAIGVIIITKAQTKGRNLNDILFGQLFAVTDSDILQTLLAGGIVTLAVLALRKELLFSSFDPQMARASGYRILLLDLALYLAIALTIVVALPAVGNILVLAFMITPAATARLLTGRFYPMVGLAVLVALFTSLSGLYLSYYAGFSGGGAAIVVLGTLYFLLALLLSPQHGGLAWLFSRWRARRRGETEILGNNLP